MVPKYEYHVFTWGGFYNDEHKAKHKREPGDYWFDTVEEREAYIKELESISKQLNAQVLMINRTEGFDCRTRTVAHRVSEYKGIRAYTTRDLGINYEFSAAKYMMENNWYPGFNDYPFGDIDYTSEEFKVVGEWITGADFESSGI